MNHAILLISCPDQIGITATVTQFVYVHRGNIIHADQHIDEQSNTFFMRIEWSIDHFDLAKEDISKPFDKIAAQFKMNWELYFTDRLPRLALFVSKPLHCLHDLLYRHKEGELYCDIALIISNHADAGFVARDFNIPFFEFPIKPENKNDQESQEIELLKKEDIDLVILARYHQILTSRFIDAYPHRIINIHHSFLPAFPGRNPYEQAYQKGVKIIGATSHYVTEELDSGPIIEQDTVRISHTDTTEDLIRKGRDLETMVLNRAVRWALERKILSYGNKTIIFS